MKRRDAVHDVGERRARLLAGLAGRVADMQQRAVLLDAGGGFPHAEIDRLRDTGALAAPLPVLLGGLGMGTEPDGALAAMEALRLLGRGNLAVGRLFEAHVNALRLIIGYGTPAQAARAAADALQGHLFGLWVTDAHDAPLHLSDGVLRGAKAPCSGAGMATRALVTAQVAGAARLLLVAVSPGERATLGGWQAHGMRAAGNGRMDLDGLPVGADALIGDADDYLRQPAFSAGAWRACAVALGGAEALVAELRRLLVARGRQGALPQLARVGEALMAQETARMWVRRAALIGEAAAPDPDDCANTVNLARIAVEQACLDVIRLVQRGLGLAAFRSGALTELLFRDLATYLRQPAPDETLTEAAAHFMQRDVPS